MGLLGRSKTSPLARARATGYRDLSMTLLEFLPHFTPPPPPVLGQGLEINGGRVRCRGLGVGVQKTNVA